MEILTNLNVSVFSAMIDSKFKKSTNPHKCSILWTTKSFKLINSFMRLTTFEDQMASSLDAVYFIKSYIEYFYKYGIYRDEVKSKHKMLFRGILQSCIETFDQKIINDAGFMSTTGDRRTAEKFATKKGVVLQFKTKYVPVDVPIVFISQTIVPHSSENEYVFLPGSVDISNDNSALYVPNLKLINEYMALELPLVGGNDDDKIDYFDFPDPDIDFRDKYLVWYRGIYNRPIEVMGSLKLPKTHKEVQKTWGDNMMEGNEYDNIAHWIPEYQDLRKELKTETNHDKRQSIIAKIMSFDVFTAIFCKKTNEVLTIRCGFPSRLFAQFFNIARAQEVEKAIKMRYGAGGVATWAAPTP